MQKNWREKSSYIFEESEISDTFETEILKREMKLNQTHWKKI